MKKTERIGIVLFIAAPVFALILLCLLQNINPLAIDAWNTTWNDEVIYQKIIKMIRGYGYPTAPKSRRPFISTPDTFAASSFTPFISMTLSITSPSASLAALLFKDSFSLCSAFHCGTCRRRRRRTSEHGAGRRQKSCRDRCGDSGSG